MNKIPHLSRQDIEERAERVLTWFNPRQLRAPRVTPIEEIIARLDSEAQLVLSLGIPLGVSVRGNKILGEFLFKPIPTILIDPSLPHGGPRFRLTMAHELGHFTLHRRLDLCFGKKARNDRDWLEWQANTFASAILMPRTTVAKAIVEKQRELGVNRVGRIFVDDQWCNRQDYKAILKHLQKSFGVSRTTLVIRLRALRLLEDQRRVFQEKPRVLLRTLLRRAA
jgi:hypothetical protein